MVHFWGGASKPFTAASSMIARVSCNSQTPPAFFGEPADHESHMLSREPHYQKSILLIRIPGRCRRAAAPCCAAGLAKAQAASLPARPSCRVKLAEVVALLIAGLASDEARPFARCVPPKFGHPLCTSNTQWENPSNASDAIWICGRAHSTQTPLARVRCNLGGPGRR